MTTFTKEGDNIYLNVIFDHNPNDGQAATPATYNVTKTVPILGKCSDFYCSIIRFDIPLDCIPLFIMPIIPNQGNPDLTPLIIGIEVAATDFPVNLLFEPEDLSQQIPVQNQLFQVITKYYYVYDYSLLTQMANQAIQTAFTNAGSPGGAGNAPFFRWNPVTQLIELYVSRAFVASGAHIFWNEYFNNYFGESFRTNFYDNLPAGHNYEPVILNATTNVNAYAPFIVPESLDPTIPGHLFPYGGASPQLGAWYKFTQDFSTVSQWTSLRKILITSNTIPIINEIVPTQSSTGHQSGATSSLPIITDFVPNIDQANQSRSLAYYFPTSQYRLVDMISDTPLYNIDLSIFWQDKNGNKYPVEISLLQQASIKVAFVRKSMYKNNLLKQ